MSLKHFIGGIALGAALVTGFFKADELRQLAREEVKDETCVSTYSHLQKRDKYHEDMPHYVKNVVKNNSDYFCAFNGDFNGNSTKENAILTSEPTSTFLYPPGSPTDFELYHKKFDRYKICGVGFKPEKFEIKDIGIDKAPQLVLTFSCHDRRRLQILRQDISREYEKVLDTEADYFDIEKLPANNIFRQHVIVTNTKSRRPITAYMWETVKIATNDGMLQAGRFVPSPYHSDIQRKKRTLIAEAKSDGTMRSLVGSLLFGGREKDRLSAYAVMEAIEETANPGSLYMELFGMPRNKALVEYSSSPGSLVRKLIKDVHWVSIQTQEQSTFNYYFGFRGPSPPRALEIHATQALKKLAVHLRKL